MDGRAGAARPRDRRVEITGPADRKMMINALNSGARCFMADLEDANAPTWANVVGGQVNLADAVRRTIALTPRRREYRLVRPGRRRSSSGRAAGTWPNATCSSTARRSRPACSTSGSFVHNAREQLERGTGPYFYLPKLEGHLEARLWNDVFVWAQDRLGIPRGTIRATVLIETILAAFEMDEILYELREHSAGLNAGRWDYIFSVIKKFRRQPDFVLPDRAQMTMTVPFMRAYTELLVRTCHRRGAHAIGGMAAFIPSRRDPEANRTALAKVRRTRSARRATGSTAPGWPIRTSSRPRWRSSTASSATGRTRSTGSATRWTSRRSSCSMSASPAARSPRRVCGPT